MHWKSFRGFDSAKEPSYCPDSIEYFASDDGLEIEGIGEKTPDRLVEAGLVEADVADIYDLSKDDAPLRSIFYEVEPFSDWFS